MPYFETLVTSQIAGAAHTAATAVSMLPPAAVKTLPANFFDVIGKQLIIDAWGTVTSVITTPGVARFDVRAGGTVIFDSLAVLLDTVAGHTAVGWHLHLELTCRAIGAAGSFWGQGTWICEDILGVPATAPKGVLTAILPWNSAPAVGGTIDTTLAQAIDLHHTQTVSSGSLTCQAYRLSCPNQTL